MDHILQLKKIRAEAITRLRKSPDFKLAGKLGSLIVELGETVDDATEFDEIDATLEADVTAEPTVEAKRPFGSIFQPPEVSEPVRQAKDEEIDDLVAEIQGDAAELDAIMAENSVNTEDGELGSVFKQEADGELYSNGASH